MIQEIPFDLRDLDQQLIKNESIKLISDRLKGFDEFSHKGNRGHAAIFAGSHGMMGASLLAGMSANKSGVGKITLIVPESYFSLIHSIIPEALALANESLSIDYQIFDSIGIGPGLGKNTLTRDLIEKIFSFSIPMVIDADALNFISQHKDLIKYIPNNSILTPHLKEWERLFGEAENDKVRIRKSTEICCRYGFNIIIKGHISTLVTPEAKVIFNATGNAGMAKAGSGDVLTGLLSGLLAQGYTSENAAIIGMYIHGLAGDLAKVNLSEETITASDQIHFFSSAFSKTWEDLKNIK